MSKDYNRLIAQKTAQLDDTRAKLADANRRASKLRADVRKLEAELQTLDAERVADMVNRYGLSETEIEYVLREYTARRNEDTNGSPY